MRRLSASYLSLLLFAGLCGCAKPVRSFRLVQGNPGPMLIPPGVRDESATTATIRVTRNPARNPCPVSASGLKLVGRKVVVSRETLQRATSDELSLWLAQLETAGCLTPDAVLGLGSAIVDALPLDLARRRQLRSEPLAIRGSVELSAASSLRVVSPVFRPGAAGGALASAIARVSEGPNSSINVELRANPDLTGYEVAWYDVVRREDGAGLRVVPRSAEVHIDGNVEQAPAPRVNHLRLDPASRWFRYFVMTRSSQNDYNIVVLSGSTRSELEARTAQFRNNAASYLATAGKDSYAAMTREIGVNPYLRVTLNGVPEDVPVGSSLRQAIEQVAGPGKATEVAAKLSLLKPHGAGLAPVEWDRGKVGILELPIEGGEQISWAK